MGGEDTWESQEVTEVEVLYRLQTTEMEDHDVIPSGLASG